ncbi:MAG: DegV family protein [Anaerolineaceae bacterium]|jgi:DegV family protein with EDD domain
MGSICIVTDNTAQFTQPSFVGRNSITIVPLEVRLNGSLQDVNAVKASNLPFSADDELHPELVAPSPEQFRQIFMTLSQKYDQIFGLFLSSSLNICYTQAEQAAASLHSHNTISLIDSQTTSIGLGFLVQAAAEALAHGLNLADVEHLIRRLVPHIYAAFCTPSLSYLYYAGFLDQAQAIVGEMMGLLPIFSLEEGKLIPLEKVRNRRHTIDFYQEFMDEFDHLQHIALLQCALPNAQDARLLREHVQVEFTKISFTEHTINLPLAILLGPSASGLFLLEATNHKRK